MSALSDRDLIQRARRGDAEAFGELVVRYQTSVFNVCCRILHERLEAEDMILETFLRARERLLGPWILRGAPRVPARDCGCDPFLKSCPMSESLSELRLKPRRRFLRELKTQ